jgi:hypothetical protein
MTVTPSPQGPDPDIAEVVSLTTKKAVTDAAASTMDRAHREAVERCLRRRVPMSLLADASHLSRETLYQWKRKLDASDDAAVRPPSPPA